MAENSAGRPTKLTREVYAGILEYVRAGNLFHVACRALGVSPETGDEWVSRGKGGHKRPPAPLYVQFYKDLQAALDETAIKAMESVRKAIDGGEKRIKSQKTLVPKPDGNSITGYSYIVTEEKITEETLFRDWRAAAWWLERQRPESYAPPQKHEHGGNDSGPIPVIIMPCVEE